MKTGYESTRERRGIRQELGAYITILEIVAITAILLIGIHTINQLDAIMTQQAHIIKTQADAMDQLMWIRQDIDAIKDVDEPETDPPEQISLGEFTITHYCACSRCCGKSDGVTATGTQATEGRTIAVDPEVIPYGTKVLIDGHEYIAEDCGSAIKGQRIDIYVADHDEALSRGRITREVWAER
jgi:3D (Asp-Asp-Asp) domain-containing protein